MRCRQISVERSLSTERQRNTSSRIHMLICASVNRGSESKMLNFRRVLHFAAALCALVRV